MSYHLEQLAEDLRSFFRVGFVNGVPATDPPAEAGAARNL
jgi:hypothetical protein